MRPADAHLNPQEFELLLFGAVSDNRNASGAPVPEAQQHLNGCAVCQSMAERYRTAEEEVIKKLESVDRRLFNNGAAPTRRPDCPAEETWFSLAAGLIEEDKAARYISHAATCDWCGSLLKESMEDLAQDVTPEEQNILDNLPTASLDWQREMGKKLAVLVSGSDKPVLADGETHEISADLDMKRTKLARKDSHSERESFRWLRLAWVSAGLLMAASAIWITWLKTKGPDVSQLLAQAYTQQRTIELRMPGAAYGPIRVERGGEARDFPAPFYRARDIIETESVKHPEEPRWLQSRARAHLLEWEPDKALQELDDALTLKPDDPGLLLDKATALFQRGEKIGPQAIDYGAAIENLSKVLNKNPNDPIALFNRAIIYEKTNIFPRQAIADLEHYLSIDPVGPWADEARQRLKELRKKIEGYRQKITVPLLDPSAFLEKVNAIDKSTWEIVDARAEEYLDRAISTWLPAAFPVNGRQLSAVPTLRALRLLALILKQKHSDQWLADMLETPRSSTRSQALSALQMAVADNLNGDIEGARVEALRAASLFGRIGSKAGKARSEAELIYVMHRSSDARNCLRAATQLAGYIRGNQYTWLESYLLIEQAVAFDLIDQLRNTQRALLAAARKAEANRYATLYLRAISLQSSVKMTEGDIVDGWSSDVIGLSKYWNGVFPPLRAYQFYADLAIAAEAQEQWQLAYALREEAAEENSLTGDHARGLAAYFAVAHAARIAGLNRAADDALHKTAAELKHLPPTNATHMYETYNQLELAKLYLQTGQANDGLKTLDEIELRVKQSGSLALSRDFYTARGYLLLSLNQLMAAKDAFGLAIRGAELELSSLDSPRDRLAWQKSTEGLYQSFIELELKDGQPDKALAFLEWYRGAAFKEIRSPEQLMDESTPSSLVPIQPAKSFASPGNEVLIYAVFPHELAIWVGHNGRFINKVVPISSTELVHVVKRFYEQCSNPASNLAELQKNSRQLYDWLVAPVQSFLNPGLSLTIESDRVLQQVPFAALLSAERRYLSEDYFLQSIPGMIYLGHLRQSRAITRAAKGVFVGVSTSASVQAQNLRPLPSAEKEARILGAKFIQSQVLTGNDAEVSRIARQLMDADIFHFAGHALIMANHLSLLVSSESDTGYLDATQLRRMQLKRLQLVVLSGCATGGESGSTLPQLDQLVEVFLEMGVPAVVATRWNVDTEATAAAMDYFYEQVAEGKSAAYSLQIGAEIIRRHAETAHPYYWAGLEMFGSSN